MVKIPRLFVKLRSLPRYFQNLLCSACVNPVHH